MTTLAAIVLCLLQGPSEEAIRAATEATAVLRLEGKVLGVATVCRREGGHALLVTSTHFLSSKSTPPGLVAVFSSGTTKERTLPAKIVATGETLSFVVLKVEGADLPSPPMPVTPTDMQNVPREMSVVLLGIADPASIAAGMKPVVTSRIGKFDVGFPIVDGWPAYSITVGEAPGFLGGPALHPSGRLFGVCLKAESPGVIMENPWTIERWLLGKIVGWKVTVLENKEGVLRLGVSAVVADGTASVRKVSLLYRRENDVPLPGATTTYYPSTAAALEAHPLLEEVATTASGDTYSAEIVLRAEKFQDATYLLQMKIVRGDGKPFFTDPSFYRAEFSKGLASTTGKDEFMEIETLKRKKEMDAKGAVARVAVGDAFVTKVNVSPMPLVSDLFWTEDAKGVFTLDEVGVLRRLRLPEFTIDGSVDLAEPCTGLRQSREGLLALRKNGGLIVIDEKTLAVKSKIFLTNPKSLASSKGSSFVFLSTGWDLKILDLQTGRIVRSQNGIKTWEEVYGPVERYKGEVKLAEWDSIAVTNDGRFLIAQSHSCINRLRISGNRVIYEEGSTRLSDYGKVRLSPDSLYVASIRNPGSGSPPPGFPPIPMHGFYVLSVMNLQAPVLAVSTTFHPEPIGFDAKAGRMYASGMGIFDSKGMAQKEYVLPAQALLKGPPQSILVHPSGYSYLLQSGDLTWVELPR
jgi:hypothetical protein